MNQQKQVGLDSFRSLEGDWGDTSRRFELLMALFDEWSAFMGGQDLQEWHSLWGTDLRSTGTVAVGVLMASASKWVYGLKTASSSLRY